MHTNTRNINVDTAKKASNGRFYNMKNINHTQKGNQGFRIRITSDIEDALHLVNTEKVELSQKQKFRLSEQDSYVKKVRVMLITGENDRVIASCTAYFVNGALLRRRMLVPKEPAKEIASSESFLAARHANYIVDGINFVQLSDLYVLPEYQRQGLATWLVAETPELLEEFFGLTFQYVLAPLSADVFKSELASIGRSEFKKARFLKNRRHTVSDILRKLGYEADASTQDSIFFKEY